MTFNSTADLYQSARPDYPEPLYAALIEAAQLAPRDRLLEVGSATGKATIPLAHKGFRITCIEPGHELATAARRNLAAYPAVEVIEATFEDVDATALGPFDLVFAATAWHWVDPAVRYQRAWDMLRPGGHLATWSASHVFPEGGDPIFAELQEVYDEIGEGLPDAATYLRPGQLPDQREEIEASGLFDVTTVREFDWEVTYDADEYIALLNTFSGHIAMQTWQRDRLYSEVRKRLHQRPDGLLRRGWGAVLHVARRREQPET